jgi:hypothetical protein
MRLFKLQTQKYASDRIIYTYPIGLCAQVPKLRYVEGGEMRCPVPGMTHVRSRYDLVMVTIVLKQ